MPVDLVVGTGENIGPRGMSRMPPLKDFLKELRQLLDYMLHFEPDQPEGRAVIEEDNENDSTRDVSQVHRLPLALVKETVEVVLANELGKLVVRAEVGGRGVAKAVASKSRLLPDRRHQLVGADRPAARSARCYRRGTR